MRRTLAIVAVLALGVSACGASESTPDTPQEAITQVVDDLSTAGQRRDAERICKEILAKRLVDELKTAGGDCVTEMDRAIRDATAGLMPMSTAGGGASAPCLTRFAAAHPPARKRAAP